MDEIIVDVIEAEAKLKSFRPEHSQEISHGNLNYGHGACHRALTKLNEAIRIMKEAEAHFAAGLNSVYEDEG